MAERLERLGGCSSSDTLGLGLWLDTRAAGSFSSFSVELFDFVGVSARGVLLVLDFVLSSRFDRRLEDDLLTSARILILAFFFGVSFSLFSVTLLFRGSSSRPVNGGLGGAWWLSRLGFSRAVRSVGSGVRGAFFPPFRTSSLLCALEKSGYGRLDLDSRNEEDESNPGMEERRVVDEF